MNRLLEESIICTDFISMEEAQAELHKRGWSVGHVAIDGEHQVTGLKGEIRIVANAPKELEAWILACAKASELERAGGIGN